MNRFRYAALLLCLGVLMAPGQAATQDPARPAQGSLPLDGDLAAEFACEVDLRLDVPEDEQARYAELLSRALGDAELSDPAPRHVLLVDRSPRVQAALLYRLASGGDWRFIGATPVSTGLPGQFEHFATPLGVFAHSLDNLDFRAEGTLNEFGIRGYGRKAMRVFDFGWVAAARGWGDGGMGVMRLQMHATDPDQLERYLGRARSKGCIRIPASLDDFLDRRGVLDADYEDALAKGQSFWVLGGGREVTRWPGRYLVMIDTERALRPYWSPEPSERTRRSARPEGCPAVPVQ